MSLKIRYKQNSNSIGNPPLDCCCFDRNDVESLAGEGTTALDGIATLRKPVLTFVEEAPEGGVLQHATE